VAVEASAPAARPTTISNRMLPTPLTSAFWSKPIHPQVHIVVKVPIMKTSECAKLISRSTP
jgi:hypothetical protein